MPDFSDVETEQKCYMKQELRKGCNEINKLSQCYLTVRIVSWFFVMIESCNMPTLIGSLRNTNTCIFITQSQRSY